MSIAGDDLRIVDHVQRAVNGREPVVALESTVIAHGLPAPLNIETALACEEVIMRRGVVPATIGIINGVPTIGLNEDELNRFAEGRAPDGTKIEKVSLNNLAGLIIRRGWGATTVASTLRIASLGGVRVFSTGGIGGVHRGVAESFDVSADLTALAQMQLVCVCAGAKSILDLPKTIERLETLGIPVVGYRTHEFPAFYSRSSELPVDIVVENAEEAADVARHHWRTGGATAVLVCVPVPEEFELPAREVNSAIEEAVKLAARSSVRGKAITPFLLSQMEKLTAGRTLKANRALLVNNAEVAAQIAAALARACKSA